MQLIEDDYSRATVNKYFSYICKCLTLAVDDEIISTNPCSGIKKLTEDNQQKFKYYTKDEAKYLVRNATGDLKDLIKVALMTGLRKTNILEMEKSWVNLESKMITIPAYASKSKHELEIPIDDSIFPIIESRITDKRNKTLFVFIDYEKQDHLNQETMRKHLKKLCESIDLKYIGFHGLRHTFATQAIKAGMSVVELKDLLGHSTLQMVLRYAHSEKENQRRILNEMDIF